MNHHLTVGWTVPAPVKIVVEKQKQKQNSQTNSISGGGHVGTQAALTVGFFGSVSRVGCSKKNRKTIYPSAVAGRSRQVLPRRARLLQACLRPWKASNVKVGWDGGRKKKETARD